MLLKMPLLFLSLSLFSSETSHCHKTGVEYWREYIQPMTAPTYEKTGKETRVAGHTSTGFRKITMRSIAKCLAKTGYPKKGTTYSFSVTIPHPIDTEDESKNYDAEFMLKATNDLGGYEVLSCTGGCRGHRDPRTFVAKNDFLEDVFLEDLRKTFGPTEEGSAAITTSDQELEGLPARQRRGAIIQGILGPLPMPTVPIPSKKPNVIPSN